MADKKRIIERLSGGKYKYIRQYKSIYFVNDNSIIIKESLNPQHERNVGMRLNELNKDYFVRTYESVYDKETNKHFLINEFAKGINLYDYLFKCNYKEEKEIIVLLICMCAEMSELGITHYDLHSKNILIENLTDIHKYSFHIYGKSINIDSRIKVKIIDYEFMHIKDIPIASINIDEIGLCNGIMPFCFDPSYDICTILGSIWSIINLPLIRFRQLSVENGFNLTTRSINNILPGREYTFNCDQYGTDWKSIIAMNIDTLNSNDDITKELVNYKAINIKHRKHNMKTLFESVFPLVSTFTVVNEY